MDGFDYNFFAYEYFIEHAGEHPAKIQVGIPGGSVSRQIFDDRAIYNKLLWRIFKCTQQLMQPQYTPPVMPQGLPTLTSPEDNRPCGGKGCLIGGSICLTVSILCGCFVVLPVVVMIIVWSTVDIDFDDDYY